MAALTLWRRAPLQATIQGVTSGLSSLAVDGPASHVAKVLLAKVSDDRSNRQIDHGLFVPFDLYFFDPTGTVLVPTRVYLPRGQQTARNMVRGLLSGPSPELSDVVSTGLPAGTALALSVVVAPVRLSEIRTHYLGADLFAMP